MGVVMEVCAAELLQQAAGCIALWLVTQQAA
jgi:hypothetical protein